jgi:hypothetical protein
LAKLADQGCFNVHLFVTSRGSDLKRGSNDGGGKALHHGGQETGHAKAQEIANLRQKPKHRIRGRGERGGGR